MSKVSNPTDTAGEAIERVAIALCKVFDRQEHEDGRLDGALVAYRAGSFARPFWDKMARAAIKAAGLALAKSAKPSVDEPSIDADGNDRIEALVLDATAIEGVANVHEGSGYFAERVIRRAIEQGTLRLGTPPRGHEPEALAAIPRPVGEAIERLIVKGDGFNSNGGGFTHLIVNGKRMTVADALAKSAKPQVDEQSHETLQELAVEFQHWLDKGPDAQPHYKSGMRAFSTGDLKAFVRALAALKQQQASVPDDGGEVERLRERMVEIADRDDTTGLAADALREGSERLAALASRQGSGR